MADKNLKTIANKVKPLLAKIGDVQVYHSQSPSNVAYITGISSQSKLANIEKITS
ncbi:unnamed protein product, partial [marine sediment metagenome]